MGTWLNKNNLNYLYVFKCNLFPSYAIQGWTHLLHFKLTNDKLTFTTRNLSLQRLHYFPNIQKLVVKVNVKSCVQLVIWFMHNQDNKFDHWICNKIRLFHNECQSINRNIFVCLCQHWDDRLQMMLSLIDRSKNYEQK